MFAGEMMPLHVGSPLGEIHGGATYFMFEVHYDNPGLETCNSSFPASKPNANLNNRVLIIFICALISC